MSNIFQVSPTGETFEVATDAAVKIEDLTPRQIVVELDKYIVGQKDAKKAVAIALRNRRRRQRLPEDMRDEVIPKNILMIGPTGVGKTEIARRLASLAAAPFIKVEATKFTEVGYVGRDVDSMVRDLAQVAYGLVEAEEIEAVREKAKEAAIDKLLDLLQPPSRSNRSLAAAMGEWFSRHSENDEPPADFMDEESLSDSEKELEQKKREQAERLRSRFRQQLLDGELDDRTVEIEVDENSGNPFVQVFSPQGMEEMGMDIGGMLGGMMPKRRKPRTVKVSEAREILENQLAAEMVDRDKIAKDAVERAEQTGIIFVDEVDKIAGRERGDGPQVSREGVQRDILPIIEGSTVMTKYGSVRTNHILFIAAGAFHMAKPSDLIPELQGRLPIRVELENLGEADFRRILTEPKNALVKQYRALLATEGIDLSFDDSAVDELAMIAADVNSRTENIGARRLHTIMERLLEEISFEAPDMEEKTIVIDAAYVQGKLGNLVKDEDLTRYIL